MKKNGMARIAQIFGIMLGSVLFLLSCLTSYEAEEGPGLPCEGGTIAVAEDLFEDQDLGNGVIVKRFHTNDNLYWGAYGYTLWTVWGSEEITDTFTSRTVRMWKSKGNNYAGYGMVICQGSRVHEGQTKLTMLTVMINNSGYYAIGKVTEGRYETLRWWTASPNLYAHAGGPNIIGIRCDSVSEVFTLSINGTDTWTFKDELEPKHFGGKNGYVVVISPLDAFPENPVDVYFEEL
ncbi:hypothetical protein LJC14_00480 [Treponema sp. OttesenSCG-928-L16]|nr:hypothetical protein [Treponema sp. OttesenSCG-928-L16]